VTVHQLPTRGGPPSTLTKRQLAAHLGRSERWIELRVRDDEMPSLPGTDRMGRRLFNLPVVEAWLAAGRPARPSPADRLAILEAEVASLRADLDKLRRAG